MGISSSLALHVSTLAPCGWSASREHVVILSKNGSISPVGSPLSQSLPVPPQRVNIAYRRGYAVSTKKGLIHPSNSAIFKIRSSVGASSDYERL